MTSQPDKLFRDKLENFQRPASVAAWEKIESGLNKNQSKGIWLKFAAGLTLFAVATYVLWPADQPENLQANNSTNITPKTENTEKNNPEKVIPVTPTESATPKAVLKNKSAKKPQPVFTSESVKENEETVPKPVVVKIEPGVQVAVVETEDETPTKTIVYTAEEVNAKFLRKKSPGEATVSEKKTSGIQKLMGLAYTIKNPDQGLGDLRQKKDEILALNFLSNEDKTNKEKN